ncbi:MAG: hypothetical protein KAJ56_02000 [Candidatus Aenigmarchaeota archaeon]|nr:hypothetical protein [Candidatus Aenigmarchaeota archaeon]MCK5289693.1 hypothetical protein [Candidatus Aenigmarchaeota archaeon]
MIEFVMLLGLASVFMMVSLGGLRDLANNAYGKMKGKNEQDHERYDIKGIVDMNYNTVKEEYVDVLETGDALVEIMKERQDKLDSGNYEVTPGLTKENVKQRIQAEQRLDNLELKKLLLYRKALTIRKNAFENAISEVRKSHDLRKHVEPAHASTGA